MAFTVDAQAPDTKRKRRRFISEETGNPKCRCAGMSEFGRWELDNFRFYAVTRDASLSATNLRSAEFDHEEYKKLDGTSDSLDTLLQRAQVEIGCVNACLSSARRLREGVRSDPHRIGQKQVPQLHYDRSKR